MTRTQETNQKLLREDHAAEILSISARTLQSWRSRGCGPVFVRLGRAIRYRAEDLETFVRRRRTASEVEVP